MESELYMCIPNACYRTHQSCHKAVENMAKKMSKLCSVAVVALSSLYHLPDFNTLSPNINMHILLTVVHIFYDTTWENLFKLQDIPSLVIISFILVTCMFDQSVIL